MMPGLCHHCTAQRDMRHSWTAHVAAVLKRPVGLDDRGMTVEVAANTVRIRGVGVKVQANRYVILGRLHSTSFAPSSVCII